MNQKPEQSIKDLIPDYVLGLLTPEQEAQVESFLASCDSCQADLANYNQMFVQMVESVPQLEPATSFTSLKQGLSLEERVVQEPSVRSLSPSKPLSQPTAAPSFWQRLVGQWRYQSLSAALSIALLSVSFFAWSSFNEKQQLTTDQAVIETWLASGAGRSVALTSDDGKSLGNLLIRDNQALVVLSEPPADNKIYQAWGERNKTCISLAMSDRTVFQIDWPKDSFDSIIISVEPAGGSETSTDVLSQIKL